MDSLIERYYRCFNERRLEEAASLFSDPAEIELTPGRRETNGSAYVQFAQAWITGFPDVVFSVESVERQNDTFCEVHLLATGTHRGVFEYGPYRFKPGGARAEIRLRELLGIAHGRIATAVLSVDMNALIMQLTSIDYDELTRRIDRICALREALAGAAADPERRREIVERLGVEVDAARRAIRPHFGR